MSHSTTAIAPASGEDISGAVEQIIKFTGLPKWVPLFDSYLRGCGAGGITKLGDTLLDLSRRLHYFILDRDENQRSNKKLGEHLLLLDMDERARVYRMRADAVRTIQSIPIDAPGDADTQHLYMLVEESFRKAKSTVHGTDVWSIWFEGAPDNQLSPNDLLQRIRLRNDVRRDLPLLQARYYPQPADSEHFKPSSFAQEEDPELLGLYEKQFTELERKLHTARCLEAVSETQGDPAAAKTTDASSNHGVIDADSGFPLGRPLAVIPESTLPEDTLDPHLSDTILKSVGSSSDTQLISRPIAPLPRRHRRTASRTISIPFDSVDPSAPHAGVASNALNTAPVSEEGADAPLALLPGKAGPAAMEACASGANNATKHKEHRPDEERIHDTEDFDAEEVGRQPKRRKIVDSRRHDPDRTRILQVVKPAAGWRASRGSPPPPSPEGGDWVRLRRDANASKQDRLAGVTGVNSHSTVDLREPSIQAGGGVIEVPAHEKDAEMTGGLDEEEELPSVPVSQVGASDDVVERPHDVDTDMLSAPLDIISAPAIVVSVPTILSTAPADGDDTEMAGGPDQEEESRALQVAQATSLDDIAMDSAPAEPEDVQMALNPVDTPHPVTTSGKPKRTAASRRKQVSEDPDKSERIMITRSMARAKLDAVQGHPREDQRTRETMAAPRVAIEKEKKTRAKSVKQIKDEQKAKGTIEKEQERAGRRPGKGSRAPSGKGRAQK
ncbi:hypothetical protein CALVIDRAFT_373337 [Calocera viscosa TUFC12733]|uniref:Uncharacterized protein n=1 Tax=Calocera viscosa (strain TUFC12733) TaxID=1330018 RepID=A0A167GU21_CALVF|nr:hypothetical protein CALVIDRAFT_373337 [Calocera viscosa TUFC12733]